MRSTFTALLALLLFVAAPTAAKSSNSYAERLSEAEDLELLNDQRELQRGQKKGHKKGFRQGFGGNRDNITNTTLVDGCAEPCGFKHTTDLGVLACRQVSRRPDQNMTKTVCARLDKHLTTDTCGVCDGDTAPTACSVCACTVSRGASAGEPGFLMRKFKSDGTEKTFCLTAAESVTKKLYWKEKYGCFALEENCPAADTV